MVFDYFNSHIPNEIFRPIIWTGNGENNLQKNPRLNHFKTLSSLIAPIVRPLESWARSSVNEKRTTSYTTVYYFLISLGAITFLHIIVIIRDRSTLHIINIAKETGDTSKLKITDSTGSSERNSDDNILS